MALKKIWKIRLLQGGFFVGFSLFLFPLSALLNCVHLGVATFDFAVQVTGLVLLGSITCFITGYYLGKCDN